MKFAKSLSLLFLPLATHGVEIWNTFEEVEKTSGGETIFSYSKAEVGDGVEFSLFPPNPPGTPEGGFYDIDISADSITWTLKDNRGAGHIILGEGSFDRYYVVLDDAVATATLVETGSLNPKVSVPAYEPKDEILDMFGTELPFPQVLRNNVILLEVQPGANMTVLEQMMKVEYTLVGDNAPVQVPGTGAVEIWNTFAEVEKTGGQETSYEYKTAMISDDVEFTGFPVNPPGTPPGGFYDIDISMDEMDASMGTITWTLKDNLGAGHLVLSEGSFDRYYVVFDQSIASADLEEKAHLMPKVTVAYYEETKVEDLFGFGLTFPAVLKDNTILLEVSPGANLTTLDQMMKVKFSFASMAPMAPAMDEQEMNKEEVSSEEEKEEVSSEEEKEEVSSEEEKEEVSSEEEEEEMESDESSGFVGFMAYSSFFAIFVSTAMNL